MKIYNKRNFALGAYVALLGAGVLPQDHLLIGGVCMLLGLGAILRSLSAASSHETNGQSKQGQGRPQWFALPLLYGVTQDGTFRNSV